MNSWQLLLFVDYRLNPELQKKCRLDIPKFCKNVLHTQKNDDELQGKVVTCLRKRFIEKVGNSTDVKEHLLKCMYADIKICFLYLFQQCFKTQQIFFFIWFCRNCLEIVTMWSAMSSKTRPIITWRIPFWLQLVKKRYLYIHQVLC